MAERGTDTTLRVPVSAAEKVLKVFVAKSAKNADVRGGQA